MDVSLFLELEEKLGLIGKITLCVLCLATAEELQTFSSSGMSSGRSCRFCLAKSLYTLSLIAGLVPQKAPY